MILATATPTDRIVDIGCGAGFTTTLASRTASAVWGYDANPQMVAAARRTVAANGQAAEIINAVLQVAPGAPEVDFYVRDDFTTSSLIGGPGATCIRVPVLDFASTVTNHCASYIVLDIEGAEIDILEAPVPACVTKLCVECHPATTGRSAVSAMLSSLLADGFTLDLCVSRLPVLYLER